MKDEIQEHISNDPIDALYEKLGRALYRHGVLESELELTATAINSIRAEIHSIETSKAKK